MLLPHISYKNCFITVLETQVTERCPGALCPMAAWGARHHLWAQPVAATPNRIHLQRAAPMGPRVVKMQSFLGSSSRGSLPHFSPTSLTLLVTSLRRQHGDPCLGGRSLQSTASWSGSWAPRDTDLAWTFVSNVVGLPVPLREVVAKC